MQSQAQLLSGLVTDSHCFLCEKSLPGIDQAIGHMTSRLHRENLAWMKTHVFDYFNFTYQPIASSFYCFVCRRYFTSKELLQNHVADFPHNVLAKAKANLVKNGIREEFALSVEMGNYIDCIICNKDFFSQNNANQHLNSSAHKRALSNWKKHLPKHDGNEISIWEGRWFHCKVCGEQLDGTTEALKHYRKHANTVHLANEYSSESQTVNNVSKVTVEETTTKLTALPVAPSQINNSTNPKVKDNISENKYLLPKKSEDNNSKLKESVYEQLEKLMQTLYYSKKVPYDVSLQYLKKVNKQVEDIVKEHKSETPKDDSQKNALSQSTSCTSTETFLSAASSINVAVNNPPAPKLGSETSLASTDINNAELKVINSLPTQKETVSQNNVPSTVTRSDVPVEKSISNLLSEVVEQKLKVKQQNKDVVEIQVLDEMEILLTEICKEEAPLAEILKCLEKFNKELDEQFIGEVDTGGELVSDEIPLTNGSNITEPDCKQDIPKLTDSNFSVEDPNTKEIIPSMENTELVCSETQNVPAKLTYTKTELLNLKSSAKHICINPDMMHKIIGQDLCKFTNNCISYNSIYSYYTATNFNQFMDFLNVYLQCSVDMCQKESWMFQTSLSLPETSKNQLTAIEEQPVLGVQNFGCEFSFNSFYDYYTGSDFEAFMEFRSQYLYCSIEDSLDLPKEESESNSICENQVPDEEPDVDPLDDCPNSSVYDYYEGENFTGFMDFLQMYLQGSVEN